MKTLAKRTIALLAAFVLLPACGPGGGDDDDGTDTDTGEGPTCTWERIYGQSSFLIEGFSANEIYSYNEESIIKYDGSSWSEVAKCQLDADVPVSDNIIIDDNRNIYYNKGGDCAVMKHSGESWECIWKTDNFHTRGMWGTGVEDELFVIGDSSGASEYAILYHAPGEPWVEMYPGDYGPWEIWGTSASDVWVVGQDLVAHFDGEQWYDLTTEDFFVVLLSDVAKDTSGKVWVVGERSGEIKYPYIAGYDGDSWEIAVKDDSGNSQCDWNGSCYHAFLNGIQAFDDGTMVAVGYAAMFFYDGDRWWQIKEFENNDSWTSIENLGARDVWGISGQEFYVTSGGGIYRVGCQ